MALIISASWMWMIDARAIERKACIAYYGNGCHTIIRLPHLATVSFDAYILDTLMADLVGHDRRPSAFLSASSIARCG